MDRVGEPNFESLTDGQRICLRLVRQAKTSKQIAIELGLAPVTVDQRCAAAVKKLNARDRQDAAILFEQYERRELLYGQIIYEPPSLLTKAEGEETLAPSSSEARTSQLNEDRVSYDAPPSQAPLSLVDLVISVRSLKLWQSALLLLAGAALLAVLLAGAASTLELLTRIRQHQLSYSHRGAH